MPENTPVYLEIGNKRTFAVAVNWPGWCRSGRDEGQALNTLLNYGRRYAKVLGSSGLGFPAPKDESVFTITERLKGNSTTDFGAPDIAPLSDSDFVEEGELERFKKIILACWSSLDSAANMARGKQLRLGPRGGGRNLEKIVQHVVDVERVYLSMYSPIQLKTEKGIITDTRQAILDALSPGNQNHLPASGPRGGKHWSLRFYIRRSAWHILDHAWEIEDRIT
jgi:hypothetical protein